MEISADDEELFLTMWWKLLFFSNQKTGTIADCHSEDDLRDVSPESLVAVRNALLAKPELIDQFVAQNPAGFSQEMLDIISNWRYFVEGNFYIERYLANHAIFIGESGIYKVKYIFEHLSLVVPKASLPVYVKTVLLPFKGQIICDCMMNIHRIHFGGGFRANLREQYSKTKRLGKLIETLGPAGPGTAPVAARKSLPFKDWRPEIDALFEQSQKLRVDRAIPGVLRESFKMVLSAIELAQVAAAKSPDEDLLWERMNKINRSMRRMIKILERDEE